MTTKSELEYELEMFDAHATGGTTIRKMLTAVGEALNARGLTVEKIESIFKRASRWDARQKKIAEAEMRAKAAFSATYKANMPDMDD